MSDPVIFLTDNGSLRPEASFRLRQLAADLSLRVGQTIEAVSLLHSHKIPAEALDGVPATIVKRRMREWLRVGRREFIILPLFLGPSRALTDYLPEVFEELRAEDPLLEARIAAPLAGADVESPDIRLAEMLKDHLQVGPDFCEETSLVLVDHGSPIRPLNKLRNAVAAQLAELVEHKVLAASMERREGPDYAFNEPLLERLDQLGLPSGRLHLAMFFLLPGRHAGAGGDVDMIAQSLLDRGAFAAYTVSPLLNEHPMLLHILEDRLSVVLDA